MRRQRFIELMLGNPDYHTEIMILFVIPKLAKSIKYTVKNYKPKEVSQ